MKTDEIIKEIESLPLEKKMYVIEKTIHTIRKQEDSNQMKTAVDMLLSDYINDEELTVFTKLDLESFYEAR